MYLTKEEKGVCVRACACERERVCERRVCARKNVYILPPYILRAQA